jgi:GNAT superfamily N-acetyltransferase
VPSSDESVAKLRLLFVERSARGLGVGKRLVSECLEFARASGYTAIELWTVSVLAAARAIYQRAGFELVTEEPLQAFRHDLVSQTWRLEL